MNRMRCADKIGMFPEHGTSRTGRCAVGFALELRGMDGYHRAQAVPTAPWKRSRSMATATGFG